LAAGALRVVFRAGDFGSAVGFLRGLGTGAHS
jgi:hypothetical protein